MNDEIWFEQLTDLYQEEETIAPSCLKSRVYSRLIEAQQAEAPLLGLKDTVAGGRGLCVFEKLVEILPVGAALQTFQYCSVCHARVAGEKIENAPIYWANCPYCEFQNR